MAYLAKQQASIQNAFQWLHINVDACCNKVKWLTIDVKVYGGGEILNALVVQESQMIHDK